jgi:arylsulfatase A-like enzyme
VDYVDQTVGQLLDLPRLQDALVAFTSDHGECFGEHGVWFDHAELYPPSVHVPLILAGPGVPEGKIVAGASRQYDLAHTLLSAAEVSASGFPGRDLRTLLETPDKGPRMLIAAHGMSAAMSIDRWYFIMQLKDHKEWSLANWRRAHTFELFDRVVDPDCLQDLSAIQPERAALLRRKLVEWLTSGPEVGLGSSKAVTPEQAADLEALGYATGGEPESTTWFDPDCACEHCAPFASAR